MRVGNGSDAAALQTHARRVRGVTEGQRASAEKWNECSYSMSGTKAWVTNAAEAVNALVLTTVDPHLKHKVSTAGSKSARGNLRKFADVAFFYYNHSCIPERVSHFPTLTVIACIRFVSNRIILNDANSWKQSSQLMLNFWHFPIS